MTMVLPPEIAPAAPETGASAAPATGNPATWAARAAEIDSLKQSNPKLALRMAGAWLREERAVDLRKRQPTRLVEEAVRGMLPKTKLGDAMYRKLKVYAEAEHPHAAQQPTRIEVA